MTSNIAVVGHVGNCTTVGGSYIPSDVEVGDNLFGTNNHTNHRSTHVGEGVNSVLRARRLENEYVGTSATTEVTVVVVGKKLSNRIVVVVEVSVNSGCECTSLRHCVTNPIFLVGAESGLQREGDADSVVGTKVLISGYEIGDFVSLNSVCGSTSALGFEINACTSGIDGVDGEVSVQFSASESVTSTSSRNYFNATDNPSLRNGSGCAVHNTEAVASFTSVSIGSTETVRSHTVCPSIVASEDTIVTAPNVVAALVFVYIEFNCIESESEAVACNTDVERVNTSGCGRNITCCTQVNRGTSVVVVHTSGGVDVEESIGYSVGGQQNNILAACQGVAVATFNLSYNIFLVDSTSVTECGVPKEGVAAHSLRNELVTTVEHISVVDADTVCGSCVDRNIVDQPVVTVSATGVGVGIPTKTYIKVLVLVNAKRKSNGFNAVSVSVYSHVNTSTVDVKGMPV